MYKNIIKRGLDLIAAIFILVPLSPVFVIIASCIKLDSLGPVIFKQRRTGLGGKDFTLYKFRSMAVRNDVYNYNKKDKVTRVGKIIRRTSLDELPQLINILKGEMSFIGPRPWIPEYYRLMSVKQRRRNDVRPGITGLAQVFGRNNLSIKQKIDYDLGYVERLGFREDLKIFIYTIMAVTSGNGHDLGKQGIHNELEVLKSDKNQRQKKSKHSPSLESS